MNVEELEILLVVVIQLAHTSGNSLTALVTDCSLTLVIDDSLTTLLTDAHLLIVS